MSLELRKNESDGERHQATKDYQSIKGFIYEVEVCL